jgi:ATP-dependent RNA/DNA helicase IGHMBP2
VPAPPPPGHPLLARLHAALHRERRAVDQAHQEALQRPLDEQVAVGVRWPAVRVDTVVDTWRGLDVVVRSSVPLHDGLREGEPVFVETGAARLQARVLRVDRTAAELQVRGEPEDLPEDTTVSIVQRQDPTTFIRYLQALEHADSHDSLLRTHLLEGRFGRAPDTIPARPPLDTAQARAMATVLAEPPLAVVHGPPGTGKTWLLGHLIQATVERGQRVWALAESNAAVDHLAATLHARGIDVVRLGHPARVRPDLQALTVDHRLTTGPLYPAVKALVRDLSRLTGHDRATRAERRTLRRQLSALREQAWSHAVSSTRVIASTFGTLARVADRLPTAEVAFVDEATQAIEPAVWVAVPRVERLVLVGDPEQLGPVVTDLDNPLEHSALHRVVRENDSGEPPPMLEVQYRMSTAVQALVGLVYGPTYRPAPSVADTRLHHHPSVRATPLTERAHLFIDTSGTGVEEARDPVSRSLANEGEARIVLAILQQLFDAGVAPSDIGVATPYSAQVARLKSDPLGASVEVASINAFQGRERPVMVLSWVRANPDGIVGFVADDRRLTVAWSRARCLLIQVGDVATLSTLPRFVDAVDRLGDAVVSAWEPPWSTVLDLD